LTREGAADVPCGKLLGGPRPSVAGYVIETGTGGNRRRGGGVVLATL